MRVSGSSIKKSSGHVGSIKTPGESLNFSLANLGLDDKSTMDKMDKAGRVEMAIGNAQRPSNFWYRMTDRTSFWWMYSIMDWYRAEVSIFSTICHRFPAELFRYGLKLVPKFAFKCEDCGHQTDNITDTCSNCGSHKLRKPNERQLDFFKRPNGKSFLDEANNNGQTLADVLRAYAELQVQDNEAYNVCITGDIYNKETGHVERSYPLEFVVFDPKFVRYLYDETGTPGNKYAFVRSDRNSIISQDKQPGAFETYTDDKGQELYPASWQIGNSYGGTGQYWLYTQDEVYHDHWFEQTLTYGRPIWFDVEDDLLTYHYIEKHNLKKYKFGYVRKMIILPGFHDEDVENITKDITDILATNDNSIPIVCTPPQLQGVAEMQAQVLELGAESAQDLMQIKDDIRDRLCAHGGFPNIFAGDVESSGGMNNESQQITIFERYLLPHYQRVDTQCKWIMSWFPQITDYELILDRPMRAFTEQKKRLDKIQEAMAMKQLGFDISYVDGEFRYGEEPMDQVMRKQQERAMAQMPQQGGGMGLAQGGIFPGDGYGPPEQGTARREDPDINDNKNEIDQTKREAEDSFDL